MNDPVGQGAIGAGAESGLGDVTQEDLAPVGLEAVGGDFVVVAVADGEGDVDAVDEAVLVRSVVECFIPVVLPVNVGGDAALCAKEWPRKPAPNRLQHGRQPQSRQEVVGVRYEEGEGIVGSRVVVHDVPAHLEGLGRCFLALRDDRFIGTTLGERAGCIINGKRGSWLEG